MDGVTNTSNKPNQNHFRFDTQNNVQEATVNSSFGMDKTTNTFVGALKQAFAGFTNYIGQKIRQSKKKTREEEKELKCRQKKIRQKNQPFGWEEEINYEHYTE